MITAEELFDRCREIMCSHLDGDLYVNKRMHETLKLTCTVGTCNSGKAFGNLFSQVSYLCKANGIGKHDTDAIHTARHHANSHITLSCEQLAADISALALFISKVFAVNVPTALYIPNKAKTEFSKKTKCRDP